MILLKILIFIIMTTIGTFTLIKGCINYISGRSSKTKTLAFTSIILFIVNITGSILLVYIDKIL